MSECDRVQQLLNEISLVMRNMQLWRDVPPDTACFESIEPFCIDTLAAEEWLQWVFLPRMQALLKDNMPLPRRFAVAPYVEEALKPHSSDPQLLINLLQQLDILLSLDA